MAWDSMPSPWSWDNTVIFRGQGSNFRKRVPASEWTNEAEIEVMKGRECRQLKSFCSALCPDIGPDGFGPSSLTSSVSTETDGGQHTTSSFDRIKSSEKTMKSTSKCSLSNGCCGSGEGEGAGTSEQSRLDGMHMYELNETNMGFIQLRSEMFARRIGETDSDIAGCKERGKMLAPISSGLERASMTVGDGTETDGKLTKRSLFVAERGIIAGSRSSVDSLNCLKLGKRTYYEDTVVGAEAKPVSTSTNTSCSVAAKRARAAATGDQVPRCQVEGCKVDLTSAKDYHRRHKVCALHSKAPRVTVAGLVQRFCQQCSRFHVLSAFDEDKRSCRTRLAGHNERRRKPQSDVVALNTGVPQAFEDDRRFGHFWTERSSFIHHPMIMDVSTLCEGSYGRKFNHGEVTSQGVVKLEDQHAYDCPMQGPGMERQLFPSEFSQQTNDKLPLLLLQSPKEMMPMPNDMPCQRVQPYLQCSIGPICQGLTLSSSSEAGMISPVEAAPTSQCLPRVLDSGRALSLLPAQSWCSHAPVPVCLDFRTWSNMTLDQLINENEISLARQLVQGEQQQHLDLTAEKLLSATSHSQNLCGGNLLEKEHKEGPFILDLGGVGNLDHPMFTLWQGQELRETHGNNSQDARPMIDLMQLPPSSYSQSPHIQEQSGAFQVGDSNFGELQALRSYESSVLDTHQIL